MHALFSILRTAPPIALGCLLLSAAACDRPARPPLVRSADQPSQELLWETWDAYFSSGEHIGYSHVRAEQIAATKIRYTLRDQVTLLRGASRVTQLLTQESIEQLDGSLESFQAELQVGPTVTRYQGKREGHQLVITKHNGDQQTTRSIPWQDDFHGLLGVQQSLLRSPMQADQSRQIQALLPLTYDTGTYDLQAIAMAAVPLLSGETQQLLEVQSQLQMGSTTIESVLWVDAQGQILKSLVPAFDLMTYRTDRATATAPATPTKDLLNATAIPLNRSIDQPQRVQQARYRLTAVDAAGKPLDKEFPMQIPAAPGQTVSPGGQPAEREVTVRAGIDASDALAPPTDGDRQPGAIIDSGHPQIAGMAQGILGGSPGDLRTQAVRLAQAVHEYVEQKDFTRAFSTASRVAGDRTGDCTEHSVLLAALLRARGIPARVAAGLVYMTTANGPVMAYHMWTLAYIDGEGWLPLDATLNQIPAAADRITLVTSDLASGSEYDSLLPILSVLGQLRVEILEVSLDG